MGEWALEIEPMRAYGGHPALSEEMVTVSQALAMFAEDIGAAAKLRCCRLRATGA